MESHFKQTSFFNGWLTILLLEEFGQNFSVFKKNIMDLSPQVGLIRSFFVMKCTSTIIITELFIDSAF
jgi:hypothetical protein